jgi:oligopeptide/dipeptide ABC transporter ATP-binding protein
MRHRITPTRRPCWRRPPRPDPDAPKRQIILQGDMPSPSSAPTGCAFHTRCPIAVERCRTERPALRTVAPGHSASCHLTRPNPIPGALKTAWRAWLRGSLRRAVDGIGRRRALRDAARRAARHPGLRLGG